MDGPKRIDSISDLAELHPDGIKGGRAKPEPIVLSWVQHGQPVDMSIETCHSDRDHFELGVEFMMATRAAQTAKYDNAGAEVFPDLDKPLLMLTREFTVRPSWLKNPDGIAKLRAIAPPHILGLLKMELMLHGGFDGRFFVNFQRFEGMAYETPASAQPSASGSTRPPLNQPPLGTSLPSTPSTQNGAAKSASNESQTNSGSSSPTPQTASSPTENRQLIMNSGTS